MRLKEYLKEMDLVEKIETPGLEAARARREIVRIAGELKISSGDLLLRYSRTLKRMAGNGSRAVSQFELALNVPRGRLKGFDLLYDKYVGAQK
jgi:hypothetical protein